MASCLAAAAMMNLCACRTRERQGSEIQISPVATARTIPRPPSVLSASLEQIYLRTNVWFTNAVLWKPSESISNFAHTLAPLVMLRAKPGSAASEEGDGSVSLNKVRAFTDIVNIEGRAHAQVVYLWQKSLPDGTGFGTASQALRITLDAAGYPAIWEVLRDTSGCRLLYVSRTLEDKATAQFGKPLPGRKYSVEPAMELAPNLAVARVLEDGPVPMGPILYMDPNGDVLTIICRCMPGQGSTVSSSRTYEIIPTLPQSEPASLENLGLRQLRLPSNW